MGALPPESSNWITEDDFKLKKAVESGASLESLAKGAVQFSRRFTLQELQDRWYALLYDPVVSAEASARMMEFEYSTSDSALKSNQFESKEIKLNSGKRKIESVRQRFYAMRKRNCNQPFDSMDFSFLDAINNANVIGNGECPPAAECILGEPVQNPFDIEDSHIDIISTFPDYEAGGNAAVNLDVIGHGFCTEPQNFIEDSISMDHNNIGNIVSHGFQENISLVGDRFPVEELGDIFEANEGAELPVITDQTHVSEYSELGGDQVFHLPVSDRGATFDNIANSSQLPEVPVWSELEGISSSTLTDMHIEKEQQHTGRTSVLPGNSNADTKLGYDVVVQSDAAKLGNQMSCDDMKNSAPSTDSYLVQLSNSLFDFTNEEELLCMDSEGNTIDKSYIEGLESLLLDSPGTDAMPNMTVSEAVPDDCLNITNVACLGESSGKVQYHCGNENKVHSSEAQLLPSASASAVNPELCNRSTIICILNTEDPEIPSNDDVFLLPLSPSSSLPYVMQWKNFEPPPRPPPSAVRDSSSSKRNDHVVSKKMMKERNNHEQSHLSSPMIGSQLRSEKCLNLSLGDCGVNLDLSNGDSQHVAFGNSSTPCEGPSPVISANLCKSNLLPAAVKEVATKTEHAKPPSNISASEKQEGGSDSLISCSQKNASGDHQDVHTPATIQQQEALHAQLGYTEMTIPDLVVRHPPINEAQSPSDSDDDIPNFSDVEAMILDVDLSPDDQDFYSTSKYEDEDTMRSIMRLEQNADASMQRAMTSQGAFAVLYGHNLKYYIKKPEVLIGRATEDVIVDIDLGREGRNSRVSRRQAIIHMDKSGSFQIKNLGKYPIFVNSKEVASKHSTSLTSSCLIEVRGMPFVFETNQTCVKQYVDSINNGS